MVLALQRERKRGACMALDITCRQESPFSTALLYRDSASKSLGRLKTKATCCRHCAPVSSDSCSKQNSTGKGSSLWMPRRGHSTTSTWPVHGSGAVIWKQSMPSGLSAGPSGRGVLLSATVSLPACTCKIVQKTSVTGFPGKEMEGSIPSP